MTSKHDTSFAVCLFPVANGALFVQKNVTARVSFFSGVLDNGFKDVIDFLYSLNADSGRKAETPMHKFATQRHGCEFKRQQSTTVSNYVANGPRVEDVTRKM